MSQKITLMTENYVVITTFLQKHGIRFYEP